MKKEILIIALTITLTVFLASFLSAATFFVDNTVSCDDNTLNSSATPYCEIQEAVDDASNGDTINVVAGTYDEQVVIDSKSLTLQGAGDTTIIKPSSASLLTTFYTYPIGVLPAWVGLKLAGSILVKNNSNVTVKNLKVDGIDVSSLPVGADRLAGIIYGEAGGLISNVTVNNIKTPGYSIRGYAIDTSSVTAPLNIEIKDSRVNDFARTAIQAQSANLTANIHDNVIVGPGSIGPANVPNGIVLIAGAKGNATNNKISANHYTGVTFLGSGVLLFQAGDGILISNNEIFDVDDAIILAGTDLSNVQNNNLHNNVKGVRIEDVSGDGSASNSLTDNIIKDNTLFGIDIGSSSGGSNSANKNSITGNSVGVNNGGAFSFNATYNWWGDCSGPDVDGLGNPGTGDRIVNASGPVLFNPWVGVCITDKINVQCAEQSKDVMLSANVSSFIGTPALDDVWFSYTINGTNYNKTGLNTFGDVYNATINSSELVGGQSVSWNVYANDTSGVVVGNGLQTFYVRNATRLGIVPFPADGLNGWWVTEPVFSLTPDAASAGNDSWYQWDADDIFKYTGPFDLDDIPNAPPIESAGTLGLNWWTTFGICGNETVQSQTLFIDLKNPLITDLQPADGSTVFNNLSPTISALLDEVYQSNSGINQSSVSMRLDGVSVSANVTPSGDLDAIVNFTPSFNLSLGNHQVYVNVTDNAGRFSQKTWNFTINTTGVFNMTVHSPKNITYSTRKIPFNISLTGEVEKLEYINYNERIPRWRILCRDCNQSGFDKQKNKTLLEGENLIGIKATDFLGQMNQQNISLFIDTKSPKILKTEPAKNKVTNGSFSIKYTEDNVKEVLLSWNPTVNLTSQCNTPGKNVVCDVQINNNLSNFSAYDGQNIMYWINMTDVANHTASTKPTKVFVDTTAPVINFFNHSISGKTVEFVILITEANFDEINYFDLSQSNPKKVQLCSKISGGLCNKKKTFKTGAHNLTINVLDDAGNAAMQNLNFIIS